MAKRSSESDTDPLEIFIKPWVKAAESYWSDVFDRLSGDAEYAAWVGDRQRDLIALRATLRETMERQLAPLDLPTRSDLDALAGDIAELRTEIAALDERLRALETPTTARREPNAGSR